MQKWEYLERHWFTGKAFPNRLKAEELNELGGAGWELVSYTGDKISGTYFFKRPKN